MHPSSKEIETADFNVIEGNVKEPTFEKAEETSTSGATHGNVHYDPLTAASSDKEEVESEDEKERRSSIDNDESTILIEER